MTYYEKEFPDPDLSEVFAIYGETELTADVFLPSEKKQNGAGIILVHGGGWNAGDRNQFLWHAHRLALHGYVACTISYRLSQVAVFPAALIDCQSAVVWFRKNADRFKISVDKIGAIGSSAGGHLVACLGVFGQEHDGVSAKVNCVVDVHGVHDFVYLENNYEKTKNKRAHFLGGTIEEIEEVYVQASPALHVDKNSSPMYIVHDPFDETVPYDQSLILANALMKNERPVTFIPSPNSGHGFFYNPQNDWTQKLWPSVMQWLDNQLLGIDTVGLIDSGD
ncbi:MAG: alpha/beta hydrolase [Pseudomonadales bacterium]|nr:alpha/beta hydrolase [Pseudomonadales bacterium]PCJ62260.1 MAG: hypothetical protein COA79_04145 [Planctomycetota bacterium]